jgi:exodeoxyribonuclease VII small subunit
MPTKAKTDLPPVAELSFEAALKELEQIVSRLEQGEVDLEESIAWYERGQALKAHCEQKLKAAESRLEKIVQGGASAAGQGGASAAGHGGASATGSEPMDLGQA